MKKIQSRLVFWSVSCALVLMFLMIAVRSEKQIDAVEKKLYYMSLATKSKKEIANCTVIRENFSVTFNKSAYYYNYTEVRIEAYIVYTECRVTIKDVRMDYPKWWHLSVIDIQNEITEEKINVKNFHEASMLLEKVNADSDASFINFIVTNKTLQSCVFKYSDTEVKLDMKSEKVEFPDDSPLKDTVKSIGLDKCGIKYANCTKPINSDIEQFSLKTTDSENEPYLASFTLQCLKPTEPTHTVIKLIVASFATIECTSIYGFCTLFNPKGEIISNGEKDCSRNLVSVTMFDYGIWKCAVGTNKNMLNIVNTIEIVLEGDENVITFYEENTNYVSMGCKVNNPEYKTPMDKCQMVSPSGERYQLGKGASTNRMTTVNLDLNEFICAMEIKKPLLETEIGKWTCLIKDVGAFIYVAASPAVEANYTKYFSKYSKVGDDFVIYCIVPYSSQYCYISHPNGTRFESDKPKRSTIGECFHRIPKVDVTHNGTWTCFFARNMGESDDSIKIDVTVGEKMNYFEEVEVTEEDDAELMCSTGGIALSYCRYISPSGEAYFVHNHQTSAYMDYAGKGLEYGDCGVKIKNIQPKDAGKWTCVARIRDGPQAEQSALLKVVVEKKSVFDNPTSLATALGLGIGVIGVLVVFGTFTIVRKLRRRNQNSNTTVQFRRSGESNDSNHSNTNAPIMTVSANNYSTNNEQTENPFTL